MDYTHAVTRLPQLRERLVETLGALTADEAAELDQLARSVPKLISILPDVLPDRANFRHNAALAEMTNKLVHHLDRTRPLAVVRPLLSSLACCHITDSDGWHADGCAGAIADSDAIFQRRHPRAQYPFDDVREIPSDSGGVMITATPMYRKKYFPWQHISSAPYV